MRAGNGILSEYGTTIFEVMSRLAIEHGTINLGQGFPDQDGPEDVREMAAKSVVDGPNQYPPMLGVPELRQAVADHDSRFYGIDVDWQSEVMVTSGATESLAACLFALIEPGDEVVLFEPLYDSYVPIVRRAGGIPKFVTLAPPDWRLDPAALDAAFSDATKLVLFNNPMNPTGKVFTKAELAAIAERAVACDAFMIADEVYEHISFAAEGFTSMISMPGMRERTMRIGSAGKTFSLTGWKVGYTTAAPELLRLVAKAHQFLTFTTAPNLQQAVAFGLNKDNVYFDGLAADMRAKRDRIRGGLERVGFKPAVCDGTYFINADFRPLGFNGTDEEFCRHITLEAGVTAVPVSAFYQSDAGAEITHFARFCFCKQDAVLDEAIDRLTRHFA